MLFSSFLSSFFLINSVKGAGGVDDPGKVKIEFSVVSDRGEYQLPDAFY